MRMKSDTALTRFLIRACGLQLILLSGGGRVALAQSDDDSDDASDDDVCSGFTQSDSCNVFKPHGGIMIGVWFVLVLTGLSMPLIAKRNAGVNTGYFKLGQARFFQVHKFCMSLAFLGVIVAVALAASKGQGFHTAHAVTGGIMVVFMIIQLGFGGGGDRFHTAHRTLGYILITVSFLWQMPTGALLAFGASGAATLKAIKMCAFLAFGASGAATLWVVGPVLIASVWTIVRAFPSGGSNADGAEDEKNSKLLVEEPYESAGETVSGAVPPPEARSLTHDNLRRASSMIEAQPRGASRDQRDSTQLL